MSNASVEKKNTRSNSVAGVTLSDIKSLIENARCDILQTMERANQKTNTNFQLLLTRMDELEASNKELRQENERLKEDVRDLKFSRESNISDISEEVHQRTLRASNVIVFGVPEKMDGPVASRIAHDKTFCTDLVRQMGIEDGINQSMRLGRPNQNAPRPLRLQCKSLDQKRNILRACKSLRNIQDFKSVYIHPDRTRMQQAAHKTLRDEMTRRRQAGEDVYIFKGKVVEGKSQSFPDSF